MSFVPLPVQDAGARTRVGLSLLSEDVTSKFWRKEVRQGFEKSSGRRAASNRNTGFYRTTWLYDADDCVASLRPADLTQLYVA